MITKLPNEFLAVVSQNNNLQRYLQGLLVGKDPTPRSWLYEDVENPDDILEMWMRHLSRLQDGDLFEKRVFQFDTSQIEKWGYQGGVAPIAELLDEVVLPSFSDASSPSPSAFDSYEWKDALCGVKAELKAARISRIQPVAYKRVVDDMRARDTLESNSGWPDFTRRSTPEVVQAAIAAATDGQWETYPAIALFRNYNQKTRLVWMFPMAANVFEGSYMQPIQSTIVNRNIPFFCPWVGFEAVRARITEAYNRGWSVMATDFSSTDAHFQWSSSEQVLDVLNAVVMKKHQEGLASSLKRMHNIPLIIGPDSMIEGEHGVSSGSNWTNFVETIFDWCFAKYVERKTNYKVGGLYAIGDDMAWFAPQFWDAFAEQAEAFGKEVGQLVRADKTTNERDWVKTLQRLFQRGYNRPDGQCRGVYSTIRALKSSVFPERFHKPKTWSSDMFCARQYMILENCVDHPLFEEFVKFVVEGQKDLIPFAKKSRGELKQILRQSKLIPGLNPTYNQEKRDHELADFASIRIAAEL
nr:MAG: RNA-dependent RNA-polymerase [Picobirnavirus sp.]